MVNRRNLLKLSALGTASFTAPLAYSASKITMAYNTGNAPGSSSPKDLIDNAEDFDFLLTGTGDSHPNRLGAPLKSWKGMVREFDASQVARQNEFDATQNEKQSVFDASQTHREDVFNQYLEGSGWTSLGNYASGISIVSHSQTVEYAGQPYALKPSVPASISAPYVTSGDWTTESVNFKLVGDNSLRQDLSTPFVAGMGSEIIPFWQNHADAVTRNMRYKMADIKSALDYKAPGFPLIDPTGVIDSTAGLNAAHAAADSTNSELWLPDGDYRVTDTIKARCHVKFSLGARIMHYGFSDDKSVYEIPGDEPGKSRINVQIVAGIGEFEAPATYSGRGIVVSSREGNPNAFGAYNTGLLNPKVRFCAWGLILRSFQQVVITPDISDCKTGISIAGTSGSNEAGVINVFGGFIRNCNDYAAYIGDPRLLPVTTNSFNGTTINFHGTQFLGTVRATKVAALAFPHCHFENHGYGNGTALQIDQGCYNVFADYCYFGGYDYGVKCTAQVNGVLSVMRPTVFGNRKSLVYFLQPPGRLDVDTPVYTGGTNHDKAPLFHFGMPQLAASAIAPLFKYINWKGVGFTVEAGRQAGTSTVDVALIGAVRREIDGDYINVGTGTTAGSGFYVAAPVTNIPGTLNAAGTAAFKFKCTDPADARYFAAGWNAVCSVGAEGASNNVITNVDYELGVISLSTSYSPTPLSGLLSQLPQNWVKRRATGNFTVTNTASFTVNDANTVSAGNITLRPRNSFAAGLMGGAKSLYVSSVVAGVSFTVSTADGSLMGTSAPNFSYEMSNA